MESINELFNQAQQLARQKEYEKAAELLRQAIAIDPTYDRARWLLESSRGCRADRQAEERAARSTSARSRMLCS